MRATPHWGQIHLGHTDRGTHGMLARVSDNVVSAIAHEAGCLDYPDLKFVADMAASLDALSDVLDPELSRAAAPTDADKPSVTVSARRTRDGNVSFDVILAPDDVPEGPGAGRATSAALFLDVALLYEEAEVIRPGASRFEAETRILFRSDLSKIVAYAWGRLVDALSVGHRVEELDAPVLVPLDVGDEIRGTVVCLLVETRDERVARLEAEARDDAEAAAERERARAADREAGRRAAAQALVGRFSGDVELLVLRAMTTDGAGSGLAISKAFAAAGFTFAAPRSRMKACEVAEALDLLRPGWRDVERTVEPFPLEETKRQARYKGGMGK